MSKDIRQLTKAGTAFYPQTHIKALVGYGANGEGVDTEPTPGSENLVESGGVYEMGEALNDRVEGYTRLEPFSVVDNYNIDSSGNEHYNVNMRYYKYEVTGESKYVISSFNKGSISMYLVNFYDINGDFISHSIKVETSGTESLYTHNTSVQAPSNAVYAYVNVQKVFDTYLVFKATEDEDLSVFKNTLSLKAYNLIPFELLNNRFMTQSYTIKTLNSMYLIKYKAEPNTSYRYSITIPDGAQLSMRFIYYADSNGNVIGHEPYKITYGEGIVLDNIEMSTPNGCHYIYANVPKVYADSMSLMLSDITKEASVEDGDIQASYIVDEPYETVEGKFISVVNGVLSEVSNANALYRKYTIDSTKKYYIDYKIGSTYNAFIVYYVDSEGGYISRTLKNETHQILESSNVELVVPANAAQVYINEGVNESTKCILKTASDTDRTQEILNILTSKKICKLGEGTFYVDGLYMPDGSTLQGCGKGTKLVLSTESENSYAIRVGARCTIKDLWIDGGESLVYKGEENIDIESIDMDDNRHGILLLGNGNDYNWAGSIVTGCEITNFRGGGITCDNTGYGTYSSLTVSDTWIRNCCVGINIAYFSEFNKFSNVGCNGCRYGCINNGGNNSFNNCGFNSNMIGFLIDGREGKCIRYNGTPANGKNMGHGVMSNCIIDHNGKDNDDVGYGIVVRSIAPGYQFSNLSIHFNKLFFSGSRCITIANVKLGKLTGCEFRNMTHPMVLTNITGTSGEAFTPFAIYQNDELITTFDEDGNGGMVFMFQSFRGATKVTPQSLMSLG